MRNIKPLLRKQTDVFKVLAFVIAVAIAAAVGFVAADYIPFISKRMGVLITSVSGGIVNLNDRIYGGFPLPDRFKENPPTIIVWKLLLLFLPIFIAGGVIFQ